MKLNVKMYKEKRGITLVALVITIIILLILAGISIAQLTGNGLFENAKLAKEKYKNAQEKEDAILKEYADYMKNNGDLPENTQDTEAGTQVQLKDGWSIKAVRRSSNSICSSSRRRRNCTSTLWILVCRWEFK